MSDRCPEITSGGLVLWRLHRLRHDQLWCYVVESSGQLLLAVEDPRTNEALMAGSHDDIAALMERSAQVREEFLELGWQPLDGDDDKPLTGTAQSADTG